MMARLWRLHFYIGMFIAPSVLFFALTGAAQLFSLHEAHGDYRPPRLIEALSSVHKDQVFAPGHHHAPDAKPPGEAAKHEGADRGAADHADGAGPAKEAAHGPPLSALLLKAFFLLVAAGLVVSTVLGLITGLSHPRRRRAALAFVVAGTLIPIVLLLV